MGNAQEQSLSPEHQMALLADIPSAQLLDLLHSWGDLADRIFAGFRATAANLKQAIIRERLQREMASNAELKRDILELWQQGNAPLYIAVQVQGVTSLRSRLPSLVQQWGKERVQLALLMDDRASVRRLAERVDRMPTAPSEPMPTAPKKPATNAALVRLREQVSELRRKGAQFRQELRQMTAQRDEAVRQAEKWRRAAEESARREAEGRRQMARLQRQIERLEKAKADLEVRLRESEQSRRRLQRAQEKAQRLEEAHEHERAICEASDPPGEAWLQAAREMIRKGEAQEAVAILAQMVGRHPESAPLREVLAEGYLALGNASAAAAELHTLALQRQKEGRVKEALSLVLRAIDLAPADEEARQCLCEWITLLSPDPAQARTICSDLVQHLPEESPARRIAQELMPLGPGASAPKESPKCLDLDDVIEWPQEQGSFSASLRMVITAVNANQVDVVQRVRRSLAIWRRRSPEMRKAVLQTVRAQEDSCATVLVRRTRPAVVDGSNVAWHGQEGPGARPRFDHLVAIRRELHSLGYFPVYLYIDAALFHQIDRRANLEEWAQRQEVIPADAGTDADEAILRKARSLDCPVVTNDTMLEHDPNNEVPKLRFEVDAQGARVQDW